MSLLAVVKPDAGQCRTALETLIDSLLDDPGWAHVIPNRDRRGIAIRTILWIALGEAGDDVRVGVIDGLVVGAASWPAPGAYPLSTKEKMKATPAMLRLLGSIRRDALPLMAFGSAIDAAFPDEPVRYLQVLGVDPSHQGQGVGAALMADGLARADDQLEPVYLETSELGNVGYYESYGFEVMAGSPGPIGRRGPVMWRMWRPASA